MNGSGKSFPTKRKSRSGAEQDELAAARALAKAAQAEAAKARAEAAKARAETKRATEEAMRAKAEAARERIRAENAYADTRVPGTGRRPVDVRMRKRLVKTLGMLGSDSDEVRASAALIADKERGTLGMTWDELIVWIQTDYLDDLDDDDEYLGDDDIDDDFDDAHLDDDHEEDEDEDDDDDDE
jgi:hypothetical protein